MNRELLSKAVGNIDDRFIAEARFSVPEDASGTSERIVHMKKKRIITFALAAALILALGTAAYAIYNWRLQDLVLHGSTENETEMTESQSFDPLPAGVDTLSLQGYAGSPEYMAMLEWSEFRQNYDRDGEILASVGNDPTPWDEKYNFGGNYGIYSQEMADTLDAIADKYALTLHSGLTSASIDELRERFGDFCSEIRYGYGYCFDDGSFSCDCENPALHEGRAGRGEPERRKRGGLRTVGVHDRLRRDRAAGPRPASCNDHRRERAELHSRQRPGWLGSKPLRSKNFCGRTRSSGRQH